MTITYNYGREQLWIINHGKLTRIPATSDVRQEVNKRRPLHDPKQVVYAITEDNKRTSIPVMPRCFPTGRWEITGVEERKDKYRAPLIITTRAWQFLDIWALDSNGGYDYKTGEKIVDWQYALHFSAGSRTTQGCIRIHEKNDLYEFADIVLKALDKGEKLTLDVI